MSLSMIVRDPELLLDSALAALVVAALPLLSAAISALYSPSEAPAAADEGWSTSPLAFGSAGAMHATDAASAARSAAGAALPAAPAEPADVGALTAATSSSSPP